MPQKLTPKKSHKPNFHLQNGLLKSNKIELFMKQLVTGDRDKPFAPNAQARINVQEGLLCVG